MKTAITIGSLALTAPALAEPRAMDQFENMWAAYTNWCATVVNRLEIFCSNLDLASNEAADAQCDGNPGNST